MTSFVRISSRLPFFLSRASLSSSADALSKELQQKLSSMVAAKDIVVFMKGVPSAPQCGFSNAVVQILKMHGVTKYDAHNVLEDNDVREVRLHSRKSITSSKPALFRA